MRDFSAPFFRRAGVADKARRAPPPRPPAAPPVTPRPARGGSAGQGRPSARARARAGGRGRGPGRGGPPPPRGGGGGGGGDRGGRCRPARGAPAAIVGRRRLCVPCMACMPYSMRELGLAPQASFPRWFRGQVEVVLGPASESIEKLAARGVRFDLAFLDADKGGYLGYYQQARRRACTTPTRHDACLPAFDGVPQLERQCDMKVARLAAGGEGLAAAGTSSAYCAGVTSPASHSMFIIRRESGESEERNGGVPANATWIDTWPSAWCATTSQC